MIEKKIVQITGDQTYYCEINRFIAEAIKSKPNKFILRDILGTNVLNTTAVMAEFSRNGELIPEKANAFLQVLGISLDRSSAEINSVIENAKAPFSSRYNIDFIFENINL